MTVEQDLRTLLAEGGLDLPSIGDGATAVRWRALAALARGDVSVARLAEAHVDGREILREAGRHHPGDRLLGVWASEHPAHLVTGERHDDRLVLHRSKAFCSGAGIVDDALVTAAVDGEQLLLLVPGEVLAPDRIDASGWVAPALGDTRTAVVDLEGLEIGVDSIIGGPRWYLDRPGFWHGAIGPAACWAGAAIGLVDHALAHPPTDPHGRAALGAMAAAAWSMEAHLDAAGNEADTDPADGRAAHRRALVVRHLVDACAGRIQDDFARALGPRPLIGDPAVIERFAALTLYRRQCHGVRDLEVLGDDLASDACSS